MKNFKINTLITLTLYVILSFIFTSCSDDVGVTSKKLNGDEPNLPDELKGLKIYTISTGNMGYVNVAVLDGTVNSTTYNVGKRVESTIIIDKQKQKLIEINNILSENDSVIVGRK